MSNEHILFQTLTSKKNDTDYLQQRLIKEIDRVADRIDTISEEIQSLLLEVQAFLRVEEHIA